MDGYSGWTELEGMIMKYGHGAMDIWVGKHWILALGSLVWLAFRMRLCGIRRHSN